MILNIYKVNKNLPLETIKKLLEVECDYDIDTDKYMFSRTEQIECESMENLIESINEKRLSISLEKSDLIEVLPDSFNEEKYDLCLSDNYNFIIIADEAKRIAIDDKELKFKKLKEQID